MQTHDHFIYSPLKTSEFRLCRIQRTDPADYEIRLELKHDSFVNIWYRRTDSRSYGNNRNAFEVAKQNTRFTALSYAWGDASQKEVILVNGQSFDVAANLYGCLKALVGAVEFETWLWIDQICIDQQNIAERNSQVSRMSIIYTYATRVYVWLGFENDKSEEAVELIRKYNDEFYCPKGTHEAEDIFNQVQLFDELEAQFAQQHESGLHALRCLFRRPYWERVWVVQELILAQEIHLICGQSRAAPKTSDRHDIQRWKACLHFIYYLVSQRSAGGTIERLDSLLSHIDPNTELNDPSLLTLEFLHLGKCSDPRDHVFGVQALLRADYRIRVDYALDVEQVYWMALESMCISPEAIAIDIYSMLAKVEDQFSPTPFQLLRNTMGLSEKIADKEIAHKAEEWIFQYHEIDRGILDNGLQRRALSALLQKNASRISEAVKLVAGGLFDEKFDTEEYVEQERQRAEERISEHFTVYPQKWPFKTPVS